MAGIVLTFENGRSAIRAIGDLAAGWQRDKNTHAFYGLGFLDFAGDIRVQVVLQVHARPNVVGALVTKFPREVEAHGGDESLRYDLRDGKLEILVDLRSNLVWLSGAKKPGVNWRPDTPLVSFGPIRFYATFLVSFTMPRPAGPGVTWEHDLLPFLPGGQFESNRRRH
jgi:hypothetical protein